MFFISCFDQCNVIALFKPENLDNPETIRKFAHDIKYKKNDKARLHFTL